MDIETLSFDFGKISDLIINFEMKLTETNTQLQQIRESILEFEKLGKHFANEVGVTQSQINNEFFCALEINHQEFQKLAKKSFDRLDRASAYTIKNISEAISSFRISDFQRFAKQSCEIVEEASTNALTRLTQTLRRLHWKNICLTIFITIFASFTMGLYLDDEMPWEIHKQVVKQRRAGQALMNAWPTLSAEERQRIISHSQKSFF